MQVSGHKNVSASSPRIVLMFAVVVGVVGVVGVVAGLAVNVTE